MEALGFERRVLMKGGGEWFILCKVVSNHLSDVPSVHLCSLETSRRGGFIAWLVAVCVRLQHVNIILMP